MIAKIKYLFEMIGQLNYYIGRSWRKIPMRNETGIHKNDKLW